MNNAFVINIKTRSHQKANAGFTLIELMISIVLGLLVVAAATQLLLGGVISSRLQQGAADAQDSGLFGLDYMAKDIRLANYGNIQNLILNDTIPWGGVVLTADIANPNATITNLATVRTSTSPTAFVPNDLLSHSIGDSASTAPNHWRGLTQVSVAGAGTSLSDQLTIQFMAPAAMTNCKGESVGAGDRVIQRYFLRADASDSSALVLACDAGLIPAAVPVQNTPTTATTGGTLGAGTYFYVVTAITPKGETDKSAETSITTIGGTSTVTVSWNAYPGATSYKVYRGTTSLGEDTLYTVAATATSLVDTGIGGISPSSPPSSVTPIVSSFDGLGQVMMQRVEHMHILLGTQTAAGAWRYYSVHDYMALTATPKPQIKSIQVSVLVRSLDNTNSSVIDPTRSFTMLDQTVTPTATGSANRYVRRVYSTTIALRNGLGSP